MVHATLSSRTWAAALFRAAGMVIAVVVALLSGIVVAAYARAGAAGEAPSGVAPPGPNVAAAR